MLKKTKKSGLEEVVRHYSFSLSDMYVNVTSYADESFEALYALLEKEYDEFEDTSSYEKLEDMFSDLERRFY